MKINNFTFLILEITFVVLVSATPIVPRNDGPQPRDVESSDVTFRLYTSESPTAYRTLQTGQLQGDSLDTSRLFKFIIHGYTDAANKSWVIDMKDAYIKNANGPYNVIAVDWAKPASEINYIDSAKNTVDVGKYVALLIIDLHNTLGVSYENIHLVGHSLGAHVSGFCGHYILSTLNTTIHRITGMDPAGSPFEGQKPDSRLSPDDADFVDVIHTDGDEFGYLDNCGDIDFYPNGGIRIQPGCLTRDGEDELDCSHGRACEFMTESINSLGFVAKECSSHLSYQSGLCEKNQVAIMGENVDQSLRGEFHLNTNSRPPFAEN